MLTIKTLEWRQWLCSGVFIVKFEHIIQFTNIDQYSSYAETIQFICSEKQLTGFYMIQTFIKNIFEQTTLCIYFLVEVWPNKVM